MAAPLTPPPTPLPLPAAMPAMLLHHTPVLHGVIARVTVLPNLPDQAPGHPIAFSLAGCSTLTQLLQKLAARNLIATAPNTCNEIRILGRTADVSLIPGEIGSAGLYDLHIRHVQHAVLHAGAPLTINIAIKRTEVPQVCVKCAYRTCHIR